MRVACGKRREFLGRPGRRRSVQPEDRLRLLNMLVNIMRNCFDSYHANRILVWDGHLEGKFCWQTNINIGIFNNKTIFMLCRNVYTV